MRSSLLPAATLGVAGLWIAASGCEGDPVPFGWQGSSGGMGGGPVALCVPGAEADCVCSLGNLSTKVCALDGTTFGPCQCCSGEGGGGVGGGCAMFAVSSSAGGTGGTGGSAIPRSPCASALSPHPATPVAGEAWRQYGHDATHCAGTTVSLAFEPTAAWANEIGTDAAWLGPVVDGAGHVLVNQYGGILAFDGAGNQVAAYPPDGMTALLDLAILSDDSVVAATTAGTIVHLSSDLVPTWTASIADADETLGPLTVGAGDVVYVPVTSSTSTALAAISPAGDTVWQVTLAGGGREAGAAQAADGSIYVEMPFGSTTADEPTTPAILAKLTTAGDVVWTTSYLGGTTWNGDIPCAAPDGIRIGITGPDGPPDPTGVLVIGTDGTTRWSAPNGGLVPAPPIAAPDGTTYVGTPYGVTAYDPTGAILWDLPSAGAGLTRLHVFGETARTADGMILVTDIGTSMFGVCDGSVAWGWSLTQQDAENDTPIAVGGDGTVYALVDSTLYALR